MRRKAAALAVGALFMAPAAHAQIVFGNPQVGTLQIYGKLYPQFQYGTSKDATQPGAAVSTLVSTSGTLGGTAPITTPGPRRAIDVQNSYLGFRGERDITNHRLKFIWQIEQAVEFDTADGDDAVWSNRNSFLGARTAWGTVKLGRMDTIYKEYGDQMGMFGVSSGNFISASNVLSHIGVGSNSSARFHERKNNSIQYETPTFRGLTFGYQYSPDETRDTQQRAPDADDGCLERCGRDANLHSYGVKWDSEKLYLSLHQEIHRDFFGGSNNVSTTIANHLTNGAHSRDTGTRLSAEWRFIENQRLVFDLARLKYTESGQAGAGRFEKYEHTNWAVGYDVGVGAWRFATQYIKGGKGTCTLTGGVACSTEGLGGYMLTLGTRYRFDRQTFIYAIGAKLNNEPSSRYDNWGASSPARGADILQAAIGVNYSF